MSKDKKPRGSDSPADKPAGKPKRVRKTLVRKTRYLALEPRIVFDGALAADIVDNNAATEAAKTGTEAPESTLPAVDWSRTGVSNALPSEGRSSAAEAAEKAAAEARGDFSDSAFGTARADGISEILIIDGSVGSLDQLSAAARPGIEIFVLDAGRDGVEQISEILASRTGVETVHIVSHGRPGEMTLGNTKLTLESMIARESEIEGWGDHLDVGADLLLYGCEVAGGDRGDSYVNLLSRLTGADVAASTDNTGSRTQGGNWVLESNVGDVGSSFFANDGLLTTGEILLPTTSLTSATPWTTVFTGSNYDFSNDMQAAGGADLIGSDGHGALYTNFDDKGTTGTSDDMLAFRVRLTDGGSSFSKVVFVGMDVNADGALDAFVGVDNQGGTPLLRIWDAGTGANISPSTTSVVTTTYSYAETTANYAFTAVSSTSDPNWNGVTDIDGGGGTDYFVSWQISFADLSTHLGTQGISGVTKDTTIQYMFATSTQNNALNSDIGGVNGGVSSSLTWGDLGAMSAPVSASNMPPAITSFGGQDAAAKAVIYS